MPSTFLALHYHVVFSTKYRAPIIAKEWRAALHEYLGGTINGLGGISQGVGGVADHVHLFFGLMATHCLADFMREVKKGSSLWVHNTIQLKSFSWQKGYGAFTVSSSGRARVQRYIANQEAHHQRRPFINELESLLKKSGVPYEQRFLL